MVSTHLWNNRFNNCFEYNILGGIDIYGEGAVFNYDSIGRFMRVDYSVKGSNAEKLTPIVEDIMNAADPLTADEVREALEAAFLVESANGTLAGEYVEIAVITPSGLELFMTPLDAVR